MKLKFYWMGVCAIAFALTHDLHAQCTADITLSSQADVDSFPTTYGCTIIDGNLVIQGQDITNLDSLSSLTQITKTLTLIENTNLGSLHGLEGLRSVNSLDIRFQYFENLEALAGLTSVPGGISFMGNALGSLYGLHNVTTIGGEFVIREDTRLTSLSGLSSVTHIDALNLMSDYTLQTIGITSLQSVGAFTIYLNPALNDLDGLTSLTSTRNLTINGNDVLTSIQGLSNVTTVIGGLQVTANPRLASLSGLDNISEVVGSVIITENESLTDLNGLSITRAESLWIIANDGLTDLSGLENLSELWQSSCSCPKNGLLIGSNANLASLNGLSSLTSISGMLSVTSNPVLTNLDGLSGITSIGNTNDQNDVSIELAGNPVLTSVSGLRNVTSLKGGISIVSNDALTNVDGIGGYSTVGGSFMIQGNPSLTSLSGFSKVIRIGNGFNILNNAALQNLNGLQSLTTVSATRDAVYITISDNPVLTNVDSLSSFTTMDRPGRLLTVTNNPHLTKGCGLYPVLHNSNPSAIFSGNGAGVTKDEILAGGRCDDGTVGNDPTAATDMMFANITDNSMDVSFTPGENATGYITLMRSFESPLPDQAPQDGTEYHVGNVISCCTIVVGMDPDTIHNIIYLEPDLDYYFDVIPFKAGYVYYTELALSGHEHTLPQSRPYPNPFVEELTIPVTVTDENSTVKILITDQLGRPVSEITKTLDDAGKYEIKWDRADSYGNKVMSGVYTYSVTTPHSSVKGLVMAK